MRSSFTGHVTPSEWRWVILASCCLALLAFSPFMWVLVAGITGETWSFMGALHDHYNTAASMAQLNQGLHNAWLTMFLHTPEPHNAALIEPIYTLLGQIARLTSLPPIVLFHVARVCASLAMYLALYQLAAGIWMRVRTRRIFFGIAACGSGFGWILGPLTGQAPQYADLTQPGLFPFFSSLANVHMPLAIATMALLASVVISVVRPGDTPEPTLRNGGIVASGLSLVLVLVYPLAVIPLTIAFLGNLLWYWVDDRRIVEAQWNWLLWFSLPVMPLVLYYTLVLQNNRIVSMVWHQQTTISPHSPLLLAASFGLPLILALPGIWRAVRRFDPDGDQFMSIWLLAMVALAFFPRSNQVSFMAGVMIPLAYFATRAIEDVWFKLLPRRWWIRVVVGLMPVMFASNLLTLILPLLPLTANELDDAAGILLQNDYSQVFDFIDPYTNAHDVVLAAPQPSLWIPGWTGGAVVFGHPTLTLDPDEKEAAVRDWYAISDPAACDNRLLDGQVRTGARSYRVRYVLYGPQEAALGPAVCRENLTLWAVFGEVSVYANLPAGDLPID